jgi:hypothetical protein
MQNTTYELIELIGNYDLSLCSQFIALLQVYSLEHFYFLVERFFNLNITDFNLFKELFKFNRNRAYN